MRAGLASLNITSSKTQEGTQGADGLSVGGECTTQQKQVLGPKENTHTILPMQVPVAHSQFASRPYGIRQKSLSNPEADPGYIRLMI